MMAQNLNARQARWASFLSEFDFDIVHISGKSRISEYSEGKNISDKVV